MVELGIAEVEADVYGDHDKVEHVEEKSQEEDKAHDRACFFGHCGLKYLSNYTAGVSYQYEYLKKQAFTLGCA